MKKTFTIFFVFLFIIQYVSAQNEELSVSLSEIQVSASRKLYSELGRILTVVDKEEISRMPVQTIDELLDYIGGVDVRQRGTGGVQSDVSIRGGSFDQVLILLNGVNITNPQTGHYNLDIPIDLSGVSRIEILQGSSARVLGANAFSGAVNIVTEHPDKNQLSTQLTAGSYNTLTQNVSASYSRRAVNAFLSASHQQSGGYIDNTDYEISNLFVHASIFRESFGKLGFQAGVQHKGYGANSFYSMKFPNQYDQTRTFFSALDWSLNRNKLLWNAQIYWRQHHDWFELFRGFEGAGADYKNHNYHQTDIAGGKASGAFISAIGKFTLGVDIRNEHIYSNVLGLKMDRTRAVPFGADAVFTHESDRLLSGLFVDYSHQFNRLFISAGGALNHTAQFGMQYFGGADLGYELSNELRLFASFNSAVRLPTFTDLYYESPSQQSNPDLKPENSKTFEAGLKYQKGKWSADACLFYRLGNNIIDWVKEPDSVRWESRNLTNVDALGGDLSLTCMLGHSIFRNIKFAYSFLHLNKQAEGFDSKYALDYLKHKCIFSIEHAVWKQLSATWKASFLDRSGTYSEYATGNIVDYNPYFLLDGKIMWSAKQFDVYADINNIFNTEYEDYGGLPQPGIHFNIGLKLKLDY